MSYKTKSLLYFICFISSAMLYYATDGGMETEQRQGQVILAQAEAEAAEVTSEKNFVSEDIVQ